MKRSIVLTVTHIFFLMFLLAACDRSEQDAQHEHGVINFEISCNTEAQEPFEYAVGLLHHMMYEQAEDYFSAAAGADADCAMAHWGIAMTQLRPLWAPPTEQEFEKGLAAIGQAVSIGAPTEREQEYIDVLNTYYSVAQETTFREGVVAWERDLEELHGNYPDDIDAGAFFALAHIATASPDDDAYSRQRRAGTLLEELLEKAPEHPGLFHYTIHAYDNPVLAEHAVSVARRYDELAPDVPHALHMPSHIFVRLGIWPDVIDWNRRSADAALRQPVANMTSMHHAHALDYMVYAYLQQGADDKAQDVIDERVSIDNYQPHIGSAYGVAASQARFVLERRQWAAAAELPLRVHSNFPWDSFPEHEAITWWARGLGAARSGDIESAGEAAGMLEGLHVRTLEKGEDYWALLVDVKRKTVEAWIAHEEGRQEQALELMREAADMEDSVDKHPVTPGEVLPARELLGDMLFLHGKPDEALAAYEAALDISPNRFNSLYGAGIAAESADNTDLAASYFGMLVDVTADEGSERSELEHARTFLAGN